MFKSASRTALRQARPLRLGQRQRFLSTAPPPQRSRGWKGTIVRWGLAAAAVYYYNTSTVFAEQPSLALEQSPKNEDDCSSLPTIESVAASKRRKPVSDIPSSSSSQPPKSGLEPAESSSPSSVESTGAVAETGQSDPANAQPLKLTASELEEEADQEGAFNPETGEINWDCPCLGGMAHGPCGEDFKEAFSCFVFSTEEPKGMDCIDKFKNMQDCFKLHPEIYGSELDEDEVDQELQEHIATEDAKKSQLSPDTPKPDTTSEDQVRRASETENAQQLLAEDTAPQGQDRNQ
ncbi:Oxidoreductase [Ophidiomyces ophidiicola]|nr:Oxidoreductase [Ophidiomyces ophidiicola]